MRFASFMGLTLQLQLISSSCLGVKLACEMLLVGARLCSLIYWFHFMVLLQNSYCSFVFLNIIIFLMCCKIYALYEKLIGVDYFHLLYNI